MVETPKLVLEALNGPLRVAYVLIAAGSEVSAGLTQAAEQAGVEVFSLADRTFAELSDTVTPQPALAVVEAPSLELDARFTGPGRRRAILLVDVADPGNVGTLLRTAEAAGCDGVVTSGSTADPLSPKAVRASAGSVLRVPVAEADDALDRLVGAGYKTVATVTDAPPYDRIDLPDDRVAIVLGSEPHGLPPAIVERCTHRAAIPMAGSVESLNVATAGAVLAFDLARRSRRG